MPVCRQLLKFGISTGDFVFASDEQGSLEVAAGVRDQLLRHVGAGVGDLHLGARENAVLVAHRSRNRAARSWAPTGMVASHISSIQAIQTHFRIGSAPSLPEDQRWWTATSRSSPLVDWGGIVVSTRTRVNTRCGDHGRKTQLFRPACAAPDHDGQAWFRRGRSLNRRRAAGVDDKSPFSHRPDPFLRQQTMTCDTFQRAFERR
jgi:hypothetical protein